MILGHSCFLNVTKLLGKEAIFMDPLDLGGTQAVGRVGEGVRKLWLAVLTLRTSIEVASA